MRSRTPVTEERTVDTVARPISDERDLDALMLLVRDAAMTAAASSGIQPQAAGEGTARELDLIKVLEAQGDWNEHVRQSLAALVDCIRTLQDDWADVQAGLRGDIGQLSALIDRLRSASSSKAARSGPAGHAPPRTRRAASPRGTGKRRSAGKRRPRS
jgi:hypothetical protein